MFRFEATRRAEGDATSRLFAMANAAPATWATLAGMLGGTGEIDRKQEILGFLRAASNDVYDPWARSTAS